MNPCRDFREIASLGSLTPGNIVFSVCENGFLNAEFEGKKHRRLTLNRMLPYSAPTRYISVMAGGEELGIIEDLSAFSGEQRSILEDALRFRYYLPRILRIRSAKEKVSFLYLDCETNAGDKILCIADFTSNLRFLSTDTLVISDIEGNRYQIPDYSHFDRASRKRLDTFL